MVNEDKKRNGFTGHVLNLASGAAIAQAITFVTAPIISRLFAPGAFGTCSVFISMISILCVIVCMRYELAIVLPERDEEAINLVAVSLIIAFIVSGISGLLILIGKGSLVRWLRSPELGPYLWMAPGALFLQGIFQSFNSWNLRRKHFGRLSIARVCASTTTSGAPILMSAMGQSNAGGLIWSWIAGITVFTATLGIQAWRDIYRPFRESLCLDRMLVSLKRYRKFPIIDAWGGFLNNLSWQLPPLMLSLFFSQAVVGYYSLANRVILLPMILIGDAIARAFLQRTSELRSEPESLSKTVEMVFRALTLLGLFPAVIITITGPELFSVVFGPNWTEAGKYAQILGLWMFFLFISSPISTLFLVLERQELALILHFSIFVTRVLALVGGGVLNNVYITLWVWSGTGVVTFGAFAFWTLKIARLPYRLAFRILLRCSLYSLPIALALITFKGLFTKSPGLILIASGASLVIYCIIVLNWEGEMVRPLFSPSRRLSNG